MHFAAHGSYSVERNGNILVIEATGPFNESIIQQFENDAETRIEQFNNEAWATLVIYHGNGIFTPEAEAECIRLTKSKARAGMLANASVVINSIHADLQQMQLNRIYETANVPSHVFSDSVHATNWLNTFFQQKNEAV